MITLLCHPMISKHDEEGILQVWLLLECVVNQLNNIVHLRLLWQHVRAVVGLVIFEKRMYGIVMKYPEGPP